MTHPNMKLAEMSDDELKAAAWNAREALISEFGTTALDQIYAIMDDADSNTDAARDIIRLVDLFGIDY